MGCCESQPEQECCEGAAEFAPLREPDVGRLDALHAAYLNGVDEVFLSQRYAGGLGRLALEAGTQFVGRLAASGPNARELGMVAGFAAQRGLDATWLASDELGDMSEFVTVRALIVSWSRARSLDLHLRLQPRVPPRTGGARAPEEASSGEGEPRARSWDGARGGPGGASPLYLVPRAGD